jgi:streptomycin 6-kinase
LLSYGKGYLLEECALPGTSLKLDESLSDFEKLEIICDITKNLYSAPIPIQHSFKSVNQWLSAFEKDFDIEKKDIQTARQLKEKQLNKNSEGDVLLHGDLHKNNIIKNNDMWKVIDPKGVIGPPIFESFCFIEDIERDIPYVSSFFGYEKQDVIEWFFIRCVLSVCWNREDGIDSSFFMMLVEKSYQYLK